MQSLRIETNKGGKVSRALAALGNATVDVNQQRMTGNAIISPQQRPGDRHESVTFSSQRGSSFTQNRLARLEQLSKEKPVTAIAGVRSSTQQHSKQPISSQKQQTEGDSSSVFNNTYRNMVNGMQSRLLQHNQEIMARSQNSPTKPMPGG